MLFIIYNKILKLLKNIYDDRNKRCIVVIFLIYLSILIWFYKLGFRKIWKVFRISLKKLKLIYVYLYVIK